MFLRMPYCWWIAADLLFVAGLRLIGTATDGPLGIVGGALFLFASMASLARAPMRSGRVARQLPGRGWNLDVAWSARNDWPGDVEPVSTEPANEGPDAGQRRSRH